MKKASIIYTFLLLSMLFSTININFVFADGPAGTEGKVVSPPGSRGTMGIPPMQTLGNPIKADNIQVLMLKIVDLAIFLGAIFSAFMFFWVGFKLVMSRGNPFEIKSAQSMFLAVVIGTAILISSKVIVEVIKNTLISSGVVDEKAFNLPK